MKNITKIIIFVGAAALCGCAAPKKADSRAEPLSGEPVADAIVIAGLPIETDFDDSSAESISLNGEWSAAEDISDLGVDAEWFAPDFDRSGWVSQAVPGSWNIKPDGTTYRYNNVLWLARTFNVDESFNDANKMRRLKFDACFLKCSYWLNGKQLAEVEYPYLPVTLDVSDELLTGENLVVVRTDNRLDYSTIPSDTLLNHGRHGWWPYIGLTRPVELIAAPRAWIYDLSAITDVGPDSDSLTVRLGIINRDEVDRSGLIEVELIDPSGETVKSWRGSTEIGAGLTRFNFEKNLSAQKWSRETPENLYRIKAALTLEDGAHTVEVGFGFRRVSIIDGLIAIGDRPDFLYGINRHEDAAETGPWQPPEHLAGDLALLKELSVNHIRPGHYPADTKWLRMLRDSGITITEEIPVYQLHGALMEDPAMVEKARNLLLGMIERDRNNPAIIAWSLMNEVFSWQSEAGNFSAALADAAETADPSRLITYALQVMPAISYPNEYVAENVDFISINEYYGWYYGAIDEVIAALDFYHQSFPDKPIIISEFGAGAVYGKTLDGDPAPEPVNDHSYAEDWQAWFVRGHIDAYLQTEYLAGMMPWSFADFRMEWDPFTGKPHPVSGMNLKGLLSLDRDKKESFGVVSEAYTDRIFDR